MGNNVDPKQRRRRRRPRCFTLVLLLLPSSSSTSSSSYSVVVEADDLAAQAQHQLRRTTRTTHRLRHSGRRTTTPSASFLSSSVSSSSPAPAEGIEKASEAEPRKYYNGGDVGVDKHDNVHVDDDEEIQVKRLEQTAADAAAVAAHERESIRKFKQQLATNRQQQYSQQQQEPRDSYDSHSDEQQLRQLQQLENDMEWLDVTASIDLQQQLELENESPFVTTSLEDFATTTTTTTTNDEQVVSSSSDSKSFATSITTDLKILGGHEATEGAYPWFATVNWTPKQAAAAASASSASSYLQHLCGASLIAKDLLLTAAHCQDAFRNGAVVLGDSIVPAGDDDSAAAGNDNKTTELLPEITNSTSTSTMAPVKVRIVDQLIHPDYVDYTLNNLIILKIDPAIGTIPPVLLDLDDNNKLTTTTKLYMMGFGTASNGPQKPPPETMLTATVTEVPMDTCQDIYGPDLIDSSKHICAQGKILLPNRPIVGCTGDSGAPLIRKLNQLEQEAAIALYEQQSSMVKNVTIETTTGGDGSNILNHTTEVDQQWQPPPTSSSWHDNWIPQYKQLGVLSFGAKVCSKGPSVFTSLSSYSDFIKDAMCQLSHYPPNFLECDHDPCKGKYNAYQFCLADFMGSVEQEAGCVQCMNSVLPQNKNKNNEIDDGFNSNTTEPIDPPHGTGCSAFEFAACGAPYGACADCLPCKRQLSDYVQCQSGCPFQCVQDTNRSDGKSTTDNNNKNKQNKKKKRKRKKRLRKQQQQQQQALLEQQQQQQQKSTPPVQVPPTSSQTKCLPTNELCGIDSHCCSAKCQRGICNEKHQNNNT